VQYAGDALHLYPTGRGGQKIVVPVKMTKEMNPDGSERDSITITITDDEIEVLGFPMKEATGKVEMKVRRQAVEASGTGPGRAKP
jgi:hypothetical protein